jgi:hypothetical protein
MSFSFDEARSAMEEASSVQAELEELVRESYKTASVSNGRYRIELARQAMIAHDNGVGSWSAALEVARGNEEVDRLRQQRDLDEGVKESISQQAFRMAADRRDLSRLIDWSARVALTSGDVW